MKYKTKERIITILCSLIMFSLIIGSASIVLNNMGDYINDMNCTYNDYNLYAPGNCLCTGIDYGVTTKTKEECESKRWLDTSEMG